MLAVFPHGLESNLLVPVLLGVLVTFALTEAWGWDFVGVVVPGYLSAVALVEPVVAGVVVIEAVLTWAMARALDAGATRFGLWYPVFGRDRFYFILVVSIFARLLVEGVAPEVVKWGARFAPPLGDLRGETFGIGLVLVPLTANRLWRAGLGSGLFQLGVEVGIVRVLLAGLVVITNYSLSGFELGFDRLALAFFASPLTQLALLLTAAIASDFNRRFGWDSHGILVPALLALVVTAPVKVAATLGEAAAIVVIVTALIRLPLRHANLEGARRVVLCFVVGFGVKLALAAVMGVSAPGYRVTDLFGFGYLLPSLLAERILARSNLPLVLIPTAQTALIGMPLAGVLGLGIVWLSPARAQPRAAAELQHFATLGQAVAAQGAALRGHGPADVAKLVERLSRGDATGDTRDGFVLASDPTVRGLVARPVRPLPDANAEIIVVDPGDEALVDAAARDAARSGSCLVVGSAIASDAAIIKLAGPRARLRPPSGDGDVGAPKSLQGSLQAALSPPPSVAAYLAPPATAVLEEAAFRLARDRADPLALTRTSRALGLDLSRTTDESWLLEGAGWPAIVLGRHAGVVVAAPHAGEVGAANVALLTAERVKGDVVVGREDGAARETSLLAVALARANRARLLVVRGTSFVGGGDVLLLNDPVTSEEWGGWVKELSGMFLPRLLPARVSPDEEARLRAFPAGTAALEGVALLWLSPRARQALTKGDEPLGSPDYLTLASARGLRIVHASLEGWLAGAAGSPGAEDVARAEAIARSGDPAMLAARLGRSQADLIVDDKRALAGIGITTAHGKALALGGDRLEERAVVRSAADISTALDRGARTLVAGAAP